MKHESMVFELTYNDLICIVQLQLLGALAGVEMVLRDVGYPVELGSGVAAASAYLMRSTPLITSRI